MVSSFIGEDSPFIRKALSFSFRSEQRRETKCDYTGMVISELVRWDVYTEVRQIAVTL